MQKLLYHQQNEQNVSDLRIYTCHWFTKESTGPNTDPCGTPNVMFDIEELQFLIETYCFLLLKYDSNQCCMTPLMPLCRSLLINMLWLTVSNAFEKSRYDIQQWCSACCLTMNKHNQGIQKLHLKYLNFCIWSIWKPNWFVHKILFYFILEFSLADINFSNIFDEKGDSSREFISRKS